MPSFHLCSAFVFFSSDDDLLLVRGQGLVVGVSLGGCFLSIVFASLPQLASKHIYIYIYINHLFPFIF